MFNTIDELLSYLEENDIEATPCDALWADGEPIKSDNVDFVDGKLVIDGEIINVSKVGIGVLEETVLTLEVYAECIEYLVTCCIYRYEQ